MRKNKKPQWEEVFVKKRKHAVAVALMTIVMLCPFSYAQPAEAAEDSVTINLSDLDAQAGETVSITEDGYRIGDT